MVRFLSLVSLPARNSKGVLLAATAAAMLAGPAHADIMFSPTNSPGPDEQNILFGQKETGQTSFLGHTNQTNTPIEFDLISGAMNGETSVGTVGIGQSDIICTGGCGTFASGGANGSQLTDLEIKLGAGFGATDFIGNLDFGEGEVNIDVTDQMGAIFNYTLGNGQNFFTLTAINGEVITDIKITEKSADANGNFGWNSFKQPRISGICALTDGGCIPVPEPSSLSLIGAGLAAAALLRRRKRA